MKRFLASLATISLFQTIGRHPAIAGILMLLGVGGGATAIAILTPPTIVPFSSSNFNPNQAIGTTNNGLKPNGGTNGALELPIGPSTGATVRSASISRRRSIRRSLTAMALLKHYSPA